MRLPAILMLALTISVPAAVAQQGAHGARNYDPSTVATVKGKVVSVDHVPSPGGQSGGVHMTIKTDSETIAVHLGPAWYVDAQKPRIGNGDEVEVVGSRVSVDGTPAIIAREVRKDGHTLALRNAAGIPAWAGRGGRRRPQN